MMELPDQFLEPEMEDEDDDLLPQEGTMGGGQPANMAGFSTEDDAMLSSYRMANQLPSSTVYDPQSMHQHSVIQSTPMVSHGYSMQQPMDGVPMMQHHQPSTSYHIAQQPMQQSVHEAPAESMYYTSTPVPGEQYLDVATGRVFTLVASPSRVVRAHSGQVVYVQQQQQRQPVVYHQQTMPSYGQQLMPPQQSQQYTVATSSMSQDHSYASPVTSAQQQQLSHYEGPVPMGRGNNPAIKSPVRMQPTRYDEDAVYRIGADGRAHQIDITDSQLHPRNDKPVPRLQDMRTATQFVPVKKTVSPPKRAKMEPAVKIAETDGATAAAVRRISSEGGWKQMNQWLKAAEKDKEKLKQLLLQCYQAKISIDLLQTNDTPKFVRKLGRKHGDPEVRALAERVVNKWKESVTDQKNSPPVEKKEVEDEQKESKEEDEEEEMPRPVKEDKRRSSEEGEKKEKEEEKKVKKEKEHRAKAKVYTSKGRSTGLLDTEETPKDKKRKDSSENAAPGVPPPVKKSSSEKSIPSPTTKKPVGPVKKTTLSTGFMDALMTPPEPKKKVPVKKRPLDLSGAKRVPTDGGRNVIDMLLSPTNDDKGIVMEGLFSDTSRSLPNAARNSSEPSPPPRESDTNGPAAASVVYDTEEPSIAVGKRRIRFADEAGKELVETRFFEIEEGERINVNRYTHDQMKHHEAQMEAQWRKDVLTMDMDLEGDDVEKETNVGGVQWRFIPVDGYDQVIQLVPGKNSQMKLIQAERQQHALRAFFSPDIPTEHLEEPDDNDQGDDPTLRTEPVFVPLEPVADDEYSPTHNTDDSSNPNVSQDTPTFLSSGGSTPATPKDIDTTTPSAATASPILSDKLKNLLAGLKKSGLVGGTEAAPMDTSVPSPNTSVPPPGVFGGVMPTVPTTTMPNTYFQEPPPVGFVAQPKVHSIQQEFLMPPNVHQPPPSQPSGAGIQVINLDVHAPSMSDAGSFGGGPGPRIHHQGNTKPCQFFNSPRGCTYGDRCRFAHVLVEAGGFNSGGFRGRGNFRGDFRGGRGFGGRGGPRGGFQGRGDFHNSRGGGGQRGDMDMRRERWEREKQEREREGGRRDDRDRDRDRRRERRSRSRSRSRSPTFTRYPRESGRRRRRDSESEKSGDDVVAGSSDVDLRVRDTDIRAARGSNPHEDIDGVPMDAIDAPSSPTPA